MSSTSPDNHSSDWLSAVSYLERRNGVLELRVDPSRLTREQARHRHDGQYRVRLLRIDGDRWLVERPFVKDGSASLAQGMPVQGIVGRGPQRWVFQSVIENVELCSLNTEMRVPALRLGPPSKVSTSQRRAYFRVSMAGLDLPPATLSPLLDLDSAKPAQDANRQLHKTGDMRPAASAPSPLISGGFRGHVLDLSGNGLSVNLDGELAESVTEHEHFWVELKLPDQEHPLRFAARRTRVADHEEGMLIGLTCALGAFGVHEQFITDAICKFTADAQRRQLQRQR